MSAPQVRRMAKTARLIYAARFDGRHVRITTTSPGGKIDTIEGTVVAVALSPNGNTADLLIVLVDHPEEGMRYTYPRAYSLALVVSIEEIDS